MSVPVARVEVAFTSQPAAALSAQAWQDITPDVRLDQGISITRGRQDEYSTVQAGSASFTLNNTTGKYTVGYTGGTYYPNVKIGKACRVYTGSRAGNLMAAQDASFEGAGTGAWSGAAFGYTTSTIARSTTRAVDGSASMLVTWPTAGAGNSCANITLSVSRGVQYTVSMSVWVVAGGPNVTLCEMFGAVSGSQTSSTTGAWQRLQFTFTPTVNTVRLGIKTAGASTSGQTVFVDAVMLEEASTASTFTTTSAAAPAFTGYVDEWPTQWAPTGTYAVAQVTVIDRLKRLGQIGELSNVVAEEVLYDSPSAYYMLGEDSTARTAGDTSKTGQPALSVVQRGAGGTFAFGSGTGPGTDGLSAPMFTPASSTNGLYLTGYQTTGAGGFASMSVLAVINTLTAAQATIVRPLDPYGSFVDFAVTAAGKLNATITSSFSGTIATVTSSGSVNDGHTHAVHVTIGQSGGTVTVTLYIDGTSAGSTSFAAANLPLYTSLNIGGSGAGALFTGTISHVAVFPTALSAARVAQQASGILTGFAGESSDARVARYARWAGITDTALESGASTSIAAIDTTGLAPLQAIQDVVDTESGLLFVDGWGVLTFQARTHRYNATSSATFGAGSYGVNLQFTSNDAYLANDVKATRVGGIAFRAVNASSIADYGSYRKQISLLTTSDFEVMDAASWAASQQSQPGNRVGSLTIDPLTDSSVVAAAMALDLGAMVTLTGLPSSAPSSSVSLFIEGSTEVVSTDEWSVTYATTPASPWAVFVLDSATYGLLDTDRLAY